MIIRARYLERKVLQQGALVRAVCWRPGDTLSRVRIPYGSLSILQEVTWPRWVRSACPKDTQMHRLILYF